MKSINLEYKTSRSSRPTWLLHFASYVRTYYKKEDDQSVDYMLHSISDQLNKQTFFQRKLKRSCALIKREISGERLQVYNVTGTKVLLEIFYK